MRFETIKCDCCGETILKHTRVFYKVLAKRIYPFNTKDIDLCDNCFRKIKEAAAQIRGEEEN